jgi:hypothetical protein
MGLLNAFDSVLDWKIERGEGSEMSKLEVCVEKLIEEFLFRVQDVDSSSYNNKQGYYVKVNWKTGDFRTEIIKVVKV